MEDLIFTYPSGAPEVERRTPNLKTGDVILMRDRGSARNDLGIVKRTMMVVCARLRFVL